MTPKLFPEERHQQILAYLEQKGRLSVTELSAAFGLSQATIRADLESLSNQGLLTRTHGGAIAATRSDQELSFEVRRRLKTTEKERIGEAAAELVHDGEAILLDASTTALAIASRLKTRRELTVVTNSLAVAHELIDAYGVTVLMPGGFLRRDSFSLVGTQAGNEAQGYEVFLKDYNLQKAFVGAKGLSFDKGLTDVNSLEVATKRELIHLAHRLIAVVDGSKWGQVSFVSFATIEQVSTIITDDSAPADMVKGLRIRNIDVIVA